ncbi:MAG TPA: hypothetical protein RMH99_21555 [Sandaracinaceae bacterium LLY-WYZ-13_1]|nr:hypothetical protein [Sandaracinaceae bacterium LLY-WYZ-13_1]
MPYRTDAHGDEAGRRRRVAEAEARFERAALRCRAAAGALDQLRRRIADRRRALDEAIARAEEDRRRALRVGLAADGGEHARLRAALRTGGAVAALERAMAAKRGRASRPGPGADGPGKGSTPPPLAESRRRLAEARRERARLVAKQDEALERAQARLAEAVAEHDAAEAALADAREASNAHAPR